MAGKNGDVLAILPILHEEFRLTGQPQNLVVAQEYASVVEGLDYVKPCVFNSPWWDFKSCYQFAKQHFDTVMVPQNHGQYEVGSSIQFQRKMPSAFMDMWERVGYLNRWDTLPLVLPRTSKTSLSGPTIFYADHSQSSPFFYKEDLAKLIQNTFPTHQLMRASGMRLKNLRDFLPVMDACDLIVSVETSFLHLAKATETPIIAMAADEPDPWRGSPWSKRFAFHCRYSDFEARKQELVCAMTRAVNKVSEANLNIVKTHFEHGYNMSIMPFDVFDSFYGPFKIYRYHPVNNWRTRLAIERDSYAEDIEFPKECDGKSLEDARIFTLNGKAHLSYTCSDAIAGQFRSIQAYGPLDNIGGQWRVTKHIVPHYGKNDFTTMEKNWCPFVAGGKLFFIYGNLKPTMEQVVIEVEGDKVVKEHRSPAPSWAWGGIRGGCVIPYRGQLLRFFHSRTGDTNKPLGFRYYIGTSLMDATPPFKTTMVSSFPILAGNEKFTPNCHHWKPGCALPYGVIQDGDRFKVSIGLNDSESAILDLSVSDLSL